jgi:glutamine amidotransferase-like uncharacterized protein
MTLSKEKQLTPDIFKPYRTINTQCALQRESVANGFPKQYPYPAIGIYNGRGSSHSWLWFVEILDTMGFWDVQFIDEHSLLGGKLDTIDVLLVSGGDTFAIAESLHATGAAQIKSFLDRGGLYIGSCAGAYLPLKSSLSPLDLFNFVSVKICNLTKTLPAPLALPEKFCTSYGCNYVFHPVREEIKLTLEYRAFPDHPREFKAPLYGGPSFLPSEDVTTLACYAGFTDQTLFLTDRKLASDTLLGKSAIVHKKIGNGDLYLLGPHLEHPHFPEANTLIAEMLYQGSYAKQSGQRTSSPCHLTFCDLSNHPLWRSIKSQVSNARIVSLALERNQVTWQIGHKVYDPAKISLFLQMIWERCPVIENLSMIPDKDLLCELNNSFKTITQLIREIKVLADKAAESTDKASLLFNLIKESCALFLSMYFAIQRGNLSASQQSIN